MERTIPLDATTIREDIFSESTDRASYWRAVLPEAVIQFMERWKKTEAYAIRKEEWDYYQSYDPKKFDITMQTVDAVVVCAGHILMIRRKFAPGKGLWALPGGFLNKRERIKDGILRELKEETGLRVNKEELTKRLENIRYFDDPDRSLRGRVISHAGLIRLDPDPRTRKLPEVRGADDADAACWLSLQDILANRGNVFEDHDNIILTMLGLS
jgi:bifunctional NMN adenylyltransferase/nudix hydrolase